MKYQNQKILLAILVAILVVLGALLASLIFNLSLVEKLVMSWILTVFYSLFAFYLVDSYRIREVIKEVQVPVERTVIKPYIIEKPVQIPVENKTIEVVEVPKTVYVSNPVIKKVYVEKKRKPLNIPKFAYIGSSQTRTFHKNSCRLGKLIKRKFKLHSNSQAFFKKKKFKACKSCIKRK